MKDMVSKSLFLTNYLLIIFYISWNINEKQTTIGSGVPLLISSLMLIDVTYISSCNIRESKVMNLFCGLLALDSWYLLLSFEEGRVEQVILTALHPIICYLSIKFILMFLFQGSGYKFRKATNLMLFVTCISSLVGIAISGKAFACLYGIQFLAGWLSFFFVLTYHRKRVAFVLKSEWKCILFSVIVITTFFIAYYIATINVKNHIANFGIYLPMLLFLMSIHGIVIKEHGSYPLSTVFNKRQTALILCLSLLALWLMVALIGGGDKELFVVVNALFSFIYICNIILGVSLKQGESRIIKESKYKSSLRQLQQEELLKTEFSNFLHDDVLQDLLSIKNMMTKAHRPDIQDIIIETLDNLNTHIREQMQDYHPVILKNLTVKENYQNLIEAISQSFPQRKIVVSFDCSDTLFLVEPYNVLIYRLLKELLTNVFKHSDGNRAWVMLTQENGIIELCVSDDGNATPDSLLVIDKSKHKGIASITEQVNNMSGSITISDNSPHGICIQITLPMKGDVSYQYFVS